MKMMNLITAATLLLLQTALPAAAAPLAKTLSENSPKYQSVKKVFDRVAKVARIGTRLPPRLYILQGEKGKSPLFVDPGSDRFGMIKVDEKEKFVALDEQLLELLTKLGSAVERDNALAYLLGHELAHYTVSESSAFTGTGKKGKKTLDEQEIAADRLGGWYAVEAGYDPFAAAEKAIRLIYAEYRLDSSKDGTPDPAKRIAALKRVEKEVLAKLPLFDAGVTLNSLGYYNESGILFDAVARDFQSVEILNNAGVAHAQAALAIEPRPIFSYPFELETVYRFRSKSKGATPIDSEELRRTILQNAEDYFDRALQLDPAYPLAHLNLAAVCELLGKKNKLTYHLNEAVDLATVQKDEQLLAKIKILQGIIQAKVEKYDKATALFIAARNQIEPTAVTNLLAIRAEIELPAPAFVPDITVTETINNEQPPKKADDQLFRSVTPLELSTQFDRGVKIRQTVTSAFSAERLQVGNLTVTTISTHEGYGAASKRGVRLGGARDEVIARYGRPNRVVAGRQGSLYVYNQDSIIFIMDRDNKIAGWKLFTVEGT